MNRLAKEFLKNYLSLFLLLSTTLLRAQVPVASFTTSQDSGCAPLLINFTNTSSGAISYQWSLGNGNNSTLQNPSSSYINPGTYTVTLIATSATGIKDTATAVVTILGDPTANFTASPLSICAGQSVTFTNTSSGASSYIWDFGDGSSSTSTNATHAYTSSGTYNVKLIATNIYGCQDIEIKSNYITVNPSPFATVSANLYSTCDVNTAFQFTGTASNISSWNWNFGDGNTSTSQNPSHQYSSPGSYPVRLIVTSNNGCVDTAYSPNNITIGNSLIPSFTMSDSGGCGSVTIQFDCTVPGSTSWLWDFGDGTTSTLDNPSHTYTTVGTYDITLTVTTASGCNGSVTVPNLVHVDGMPFVNFTVVQDSGCAPYTAQFTNLTVGANSYSWKFGNGDSSYLTNPTTTYTQGGYFSVTLTATSPYGCTNSLTRNQLVRVFAPTAYFNATPRIGCPGMAVQFTHTGNSINVTSYFWNFGDGTTSTAQNPTHTYNAIGNYNVWLVVTNSFGCIDTVYKGNHIQVVSGITPYTVPDTMYVCQDNPIAFTDPTTGSNSWNWNFGNGSGSTSQSPSTIYTTPGVYTVTLQTSMAGGCSQTFNPFVIVKVIPYVPRPIEFTFTNTCKPYVLNFSTQTLNITEYNWDFGDGGTSTLANPTHTYAQSGTYVITLNIKVGEGCLTSISKTITLGYTNPAQASSHDICLGSSVNFTLSNLPAFVAANWLFGDGNFSNQLQPTHTYTTAGSYQVTLITRDTSGCLDTFLLAPQIVVNNPIPSFSAPTVACIHIPMTFQNTSQNASSYLWDFGDGSTSTDSTPTHTYHAGGVYTITLTATMNSCSVTTVYTNYMTVADPNAAFTFTTSGQCMPVTVNFTNQSTPALLWNWHFGNGDSAQTQHPVYTYLSDPTDSITLFITDINGCVDSAKITPFPYYAAGASVDVAIGCIPHTSHFSDLSNGAINWFWQFGDGGTSTLQNPSHQYTANGHYTVTLVAEFPGGCFDTIVYTDMVHIASPVADFFSPSLAGCSPTQISFVNTTNDATQFSWSFGDGGASSNVNPQHIYYIPGTYSISLIATNSYGCIDTIVKPDYISIPGTYTLFGISTLSGCQGENIAFTDSSINASEWSWDFGDGSIDSIRHPQHIYQDTGSYTVTLITQDSIGCTSSYIYPTQIQIHPVPLASASVTDSVGCNSFSTGFINNSQGSVQYFWNFGDGNTSNATNPSHTYLQSGLFNPILVAITSFGCKDTFQFNSGIDVLQTPEAAILYNDTMGCAPAIFQFTDGSQSLQNANYIWTCSNGTTGTGSTFSPQINAAGNYTVELIVNNSNGCSDTAVQNIIVNPSPTATASVDLNSGCTPLTVQFTNTSSGATSYNWNYGNGVGSTTASPNYTYAIAGNYNPQLIATNNFGCTDTFDFNPGIAALLTPDISFTASSPTACYGDLVNFIPSLTDTMQPAFAWDFGFTTSTLQNPGIISSAPGIFDVSLIVTNSNGCSDTMNRPTYFEVFDTIPPAVSPLASVSVISDDQVIITWFNGNETDISAYKLYRYNPVTLTWSLIYTDNNPVLQTTASTSSYTDNGLDTRNNTYTYLIQTTDRCGYELPLSNSTPHTTINVSTNKNGLIIFVNWTPYAGCPISSYNVYRTERPNGSPVLIANVSNSTLNYTDTTLSCPYQYEYRIEALELCGTTFNSFSDTSAIWPVNVLLNQQSNIVKSTVIDNSNILTEWMVPILFPNRVLEYKVYRSTDNINFSLVAIIPSNATFYIDSDVDVQQLSYTYKVIVVNDCNLDGKESNIGKSIVIDGKWKDHRTYLYWNKYDFWDTGIDHYTIEFLSPQGTWVPVKTVDGNTTHTEIDD
jgi:PKD repeat protein